MDRRMMISQDYLSCPGCRELLTREDVEDFGECPYCSHRFEADDAFEDFLLQPVIEQWKTFYESEHRPVSGMP